MGRHVAAALLAGVLLLCKHLLVGDALGSYLGAAHSGLPVYNASSTSLHSHGFPSIRANCSMVILRHIAKTGGSNAQRFFWRLGALTRGKWRDALLFNARGHDSSRFQTPMLWAAFMKEVRRDGPEFMRKYPFVFVSHHRDTEVNYEMRVTPDIEFLRDLYRSHGCHFVYFTMLREPLGLQISTYNYHVKDFKFKDETIKDIIDFTTQDITALYLAGTPPSHFNKKAKMGIHGVHQELTPAMWETVKKEMDRFDVIGFTNQWKATLHVVLLMAGEIDYAPYAYHTDLGQYQACAHSSCVQAKDLSGEELAQLNSLGKGDQWLYDLAQSKFGNLLKLSETAYSDFLQALAMRELSCALMEDIRKLDPMPIEIDRFVVPEPLPPAYVRGDLLAYGCLQKRPHHIRTSFDERDLFECALPSHGSNPGESAAPSPTTVAEFSTMICDRVAFNSIYDHTYVEHCSDFRCSNLQANETFCRRAIDLNNVRACEPTFRRAVDRGQEISYGYFQSPDHKMARRWPVDEPLIQEYEIQQFPSLWPKPITAHHLRLTFCSSEEWMPRDAEGYPRNLDGEELSSWCNDFKAGICPSGGQGR